MAKHKRVCCLEKKRKKNGDRDPIFNVTGGRRMLKNDLLAPYLLKERMDCDQTRKDIAF